VRRANVLAGAQGLLREIPVAAVAGLQWVVTAWFFALGAVVGSFLNVLIYRLPRGLTINQPRRSFCPRCKSPIGWRDNIPILSYLLLHGCCRHCGGPISARYPMVETVTGLLFALVYYRQGAQLGTDLGQVIVMLLLVSLLVVASAVDMEWLIIPDEISFFGLAGGLLAGFLLPGLHVGTASYQTFASLTGVAHLDGLIASVIGAAGGGLLVLFMAVVGTVVFRKEAMGFGDVKLMALVGAFFGWKVAVIAFFLSPFIGLLYGIPVLLTTNENVMPYGPFLSIGAIMAIVFRDGLCSFLDPLVYLVQTRL
jgi:leader peptidase (prepilin peptidase)/N-methyltransferase